ncbi:uncharacterized protein PRCAT00005181001 [Priceomyces carsonii]|uniref:uncharacterized protein n=1 Tax=Priceomyces carsonii TaxID=28549 RepID=UPI002EDB7313|nr:unnamed protein product [Priceomyces carsonii]
MEQIPEGSEDLQGGKTTPGGKIYDNGLQMPVSFEKLDYKQFHVDQKLDPISEGSYLEGLFIQLLKRANSDILFDAVLSLSCHHLSENAFSSLGVCKNGKASDIYELNHYLKESAAKHYSATISKLLSSLESPDHDIVTSIAASSVLHKVAIYEETDLKESAVFTNGMISIFVDFLISTNTYSKAVISVANFLVFAYCSFYFPSYKPTVILEYYSVLKDFESAIAGIENSSILYHFENLSRFAYSLVIAIEQGELDRPFAIFSLLRKWIAIIPPKLHILDSIKDPLERCLLYLFKTLLNILDNVFPKAIFFFLQNFDGLNSMFCKQNQGKNHSCPDLRIKEINTYCIRVSSFFERRSNFLAILYTSNKILNISEPSLLAANINEIMIERFKESCIKFYNYLHFPRGCQLVCTNTAAENIQNTFNTDIFEYNKDHYHHFKDMATQYRALLPFADKLRDPELLYEVSNFTDASTGDLLLEKSQALQSRFEFTPFYFSFHKYTIQSYQNLLAFDYHLLYQNGRFPSLQSSELDPTTGLLDADRDLMLLFYSTGIKEMHQNLQASIMETKDALIKTFVDYEEMRRVLFDLPES